jgi:glycosyltransferase involved in cell wall biosynthesis
MRSKPIVSVVMPVLNPHPVYFRQAIESVLNQTFEDWELVIVEDPSPRPAVEILKDYPDPRIRHFVNPQRTSLVKQRNRALHEAKAELIACQDADDISEPERLEKQVKFMENYPEVAVLGTWLRVIDEDGQTLGFRRYPCDHDDIVRAMRIYNPIGQPSVMFRREVALKHGGYRYEKFSGIGEDYDLWCRLAKKGERFANLPEPLVRYRVHLAGIKTSKLRDALRGTIEIKQLHFGADMDFRARLRLVGERLLLFLPPKFVLWLFLKTSIKP